MEDEGEEEKDSDGIPSLADLARRVGAHAEDDAADEGESEEAAGSGPSFADLADDVRQRRAGTAGRSSEVDDVGGDRPAADEGFSWVESGASEPETGFEGDAKTQALLELIRDDSNVLLVGELLCPEEYDICTRLLGADDASNLLLVTLTQSPEERLNVCRSYLGELPGDTTVVSIGDPAQSGRTSTMATEGDGEITVETVADPSDLMRVGITISRALSAFEADGAQTSVCFHSLTALLQFVEDRRTAFRFLHTLRGRVRATGARAHYHIDPGAHDEQLLSLFRPLFDVTVRIEDDGSISIDRG